MAGSFYPSDADELRLQVDSLLEAARRGQGSMPRQAPKAVILPHAGYVYSGPVAATGYARVELGRGKVRRVVLVGPSHRVAFRGLALSGAEAWTTPGRTTLVDRGGNETAAKVPGVQVFDAAHVREHSLEVHVPFLREALGDVTLVPVVVGDATGEDVARLLEALWDGDETLIVVSSDLSHYLRYAEARTLDAATAQAVEKLDPTGIGLDQACGRIGMQGLLLTARAHGLHPTTLDLRSSGDTAGPRDEVVGYGAFAFA